ncbi:hypothetical protein U9M48_016973 [Paspalum notatum var. saurae]|uniref:Uncharacterized protein n=1 Tax=Paspalum notatum var. saurae TaxID=547442 RepID=A0AAQ3T776_PASNO
MLAAPHWIPGSSRADRGLAGRRELGAEAGASFPSFAAAASEGDWVRRRESGIPSFRLVLIASSLCCEMDWKCEVSSCPRCVLDVFKASSSVLHFMGFPGGSEEEGENVLVAARITHSRSTTKV